MNKLIKKDLFRYVGNDCHRLLCRLRLILFTPACRYIFYFRKTQGGGVFKYLWMCLLRIQQIKTGIQIPYQTKIGEGFYIGHFGQIIVNENAVIGRDFNIAAGALVGASQGKRKGYPTIGDNVKIGTNAIVIGKVLIGNNVLIAPGAFVNFDVPDNSIVIGNPGQIIQKEYNPVAPYNRNPVDKYTDC